MRLMNFFSAHYFSAISHVCARDAYYAIHMVVLTALPLVLTACSLTSDPEVIVRGNILDVESEQPISGAAVQVAQIALRRSFEARTDKEGNFEVSGSRESFITKNVSELVAEGELSQEYRLKVSHPRFIKEQFHEFTVVKDANPLVIDLGAFYLLAKEDAQ